MVFAECNKADIDWCMRLPKDQPLVDLKVGKLLGQHGEGDVTLEPISPQNILSFHRKNSDLEKLICYPRCSNIEHKKDCVHLLACLE